MALGACAVAGAEPARSVADERAVVSGSFAGVRSTERTPPERIRVAPVLIGADETTSTAAALARAFGLWENGNPRQAADIFDRLTSYDPLGAIAAELTYWAALAHEEAGEHEAAAQRFERVGAHFPDHGWAKDAELRAVRLWGFVEQWQRAAALGRRLLASGEPWSPSAEVALHSACALARLEQGDIEQAEYHVGKGRGIQSRAGLDRLDWIPRDAAQLYFALGELRRYHGSRLVFAPLPADFPEHFERRAQLLLDAQSAYLDVMRARDAHWSAKAGLRIGQLYQSLHEDVLRAPLPPDVPQRRRRLFRDAVRLRYLVLLEKGVAVYRRTLNMAERTGEASPWVDEARARLQVLEKRLAAENASLDDSPHSREDLSRVLAGIQERQQDAPPVAPSAGGKASAAH